MSKTLLSRALGAGALALSLGALAAGSAHAATAPGCTDSWTNAAGGQWDTGSNWSTGSAPGAGDTACITQAGNYTVVVGNETITVAALTVGGPGATPTLQIGNGGSGEANFTVSGAVSNAGTISAGWEGSYSFGTLANSGTFLVPASGFTSSYSFGAVSNTGAFTVDDVANVSLDDGATFDNAGGTVSAIAPLSISSPTAGDGTLQLDSGGTVTSASSGEVNVADTTAVDGGSICGGALYVGNHDGATGGTLAFATTPGTGPACPSGQASDQVFITNTHSTLSGTIPAAYTVTAGDGGSSYNYTALAGNVVNEGTFVPGYGATVTGNGTTDELTNQGTISVPSSGYTTALNTTLVNSGTLTIGDQLAAALVTGQKWSNSATGSIIVGSGTTLAIDSPSGRPATFTQSGSIQSAGAFNVADPVLVKGGSICGNPLNIGSGDTGQGGTLTFASGVKASSCASGVASEQLFVYNVTAALDGNVPAGYTVTIGDGGHGLAHVSTPASLTNAGALVVGDEATLTVNGTLTNSGKLTVPASGYTSQINGSIVNPGTMTVDDGLAISGSLTNSRTLKLAPGVALAISRNYTQSSAAKLKDPITSSGYGTLSATGKAKLAGTASLNSTTAASSGSQARFITAGAVSGTFSKVSGPFTLAYDATGVTATAN